MKQQMNERHWHGSLAPGKQHQNRRTPWTKVGLCIALSGCAAALAGMPANGSGTASAAHTLPRSMAELAGLTVALPTKITEPARASKANAAAESDSLADADLRPEIPVNTGRPKLRTVMAPIQFDRSPRRGQQNDSNLRGLCPPVTTTHSSIDFQGTNQTLVVQAGMVENEEAAVSFQINPAEFPIVLRSAEIVWSSQDLAEEVTIGYQFRVYEGNPKDGIPVFVEPSASAEEGGTLPDVVLNPVTAPAVNLTILIDANDPDQILLTNDDPGTNATFSVGFRIIKHNQPATANEECLLGILPAACAGPPNEFNGFPTTDGPFIGAAPDAPLQNWLLVRPNCGPCAVPCNAPPFTTNCWWRFDQLHSFGIPISGDWNIRVTYEPANCPEEEGACCLPNGTCQENVVNTTCVSMNGTFQGDGSVCADITCPQPTGACCHTPAGATEPTCQNELTFNECAALNDSFWLGANTTCTAGACDPPEGACCVPTTGGCLQRTQAFCDIAGGVWLGANTPCVDCFGVCCMPDGSCQDNGGIGLLQDECIAIGGAWDGTIISCASADCPDPIGACCLSNGNCLPNQTEADCIVFAGEWGGAGTTCLEACVDPIGACCLSNGNCLDAQTEADCAIFGGTWAGEATNCTTACSCPGDSNGDGIVDVLDLLDVISNWGSDGSGGGDVNGDGIVNVADLLEVISNWGSQCW